jgi:hypothetical protein
MTRSCSILVLLFLVSIAFAQVPRKISFQGVLTDTVGNPRPDGTYSLTFRIYEASTGNPPLWSEARTVSLKRGLLSVLLGETTPIPDALKFDRPYWLGIQLGSSAELSPRTELTAVGYSFRSVRADTAQVAKDIAPGTAVRVVNGITDEVTLVPGSNVSINQIGNTLRISAGGGGGSLRFPIADTSASDEAVLALTNTGYGGAISGESKQGGIGVSGQSNYIAVSGYSTGATGVQGGGPTRGVYGLSDLGTGVEGGHTLQSGTSPGVYGWSASQENDAIGILGEITSPSAGFGSIAVKGVNRGMAFADIGVWGEATGKGFGVLGIMTSGTGFAVFASGRIGSSGSQLFRIDHPQDPTGKYLLHYSAESPDVLNMYTGNVVTDATGYATIALPDYFGEINKDPRYTLTVINEGAADFVQTMVVQKIRNNSFVIRTSKPAIEVSWEVKAVRNDLWIRASGAPVQLEKQGLERGKYQHPELYGMPKEMGMNYHPERERATPALEPVRTTPPESKMEKGSSR